MKRPFGTTPNAQILRALRKQSEPFPVEFYPPGVTGRDHARLWLSRSDFVNLLDALKYVAFTAKTAGIPSLGEWARDLRIAILATLGLEEKRE